MAVWLLALILTAHPSISHHNHGGPVPHIKGDGNDRPMDNLPEYNPNEETNSETHDA